MLFILIIYNEKIRKKYKAVCTYVQTQTNILDIVTDMSSRQVYLETRTDRIEQQLNNIQVEPSGLKNTSILENRFSRYII